MTEHSAIADLGRLSASGRVPPPEVLARRARRWGWWFYVEGWLRGSKAWAISLLVYMVLMPLLYLTALGLGLGHGVADSWMRCGRLHLGRAGVGRQDGFEMGGEAQCRLAASGGAVPDPLALDGQCRQKREQRVGVPRTVHRVGGRERGEVVAERAHHPAAVGGSTRVSPQVSTARPTSWTR